MAATRYTPADGHFATFRWLDYTEDDDKWWLAAYDFLFTFCSNQGSISSGFRHFGDVIFFRLKDVSGDNIATMSGGFDFQHCVSYQRSIVTIPLKRTAF